MIDDLGKDWVSCYGADAIKTPNIDSLAEGGMKFIMRIPWDHALHHALLCLPASILRTGWVSHWDIPRWGSGILTGRKKKTPPLPVSRKTWSCVTCAVGKWQLNDFRIAPDALKKHGFDDWAMWTGFETGVPASDYRYQNPYINTPQTGSRTYVGKFWTRYLHRTNDPIHA